jgi:hypothetical protein
LAPILAYEPQQQTPLPVERGEGALSEAKGG